MKVLRLKLANSLFIFIGRLTEVKSLYGHCQPQYILIYWLTSLIRTQFTLGESNTPVIQDFLTTTNLMDVYQVGHFNEFFFGL